MEKFKLGTYWYIEKPDPKSIWLLVDSRDDAKAIPLPALKIRKGMDKGKILKQILDANELLAQQSDIVTDVFPPPWAV